MGNINLKTILAECRAGDPLQTPAWKGLMAKALAYLREYHPDHLPEFKSLARDPATGHASEAKVIQAQVCGYLETLADF